MRYLFAVLILCFLGCQSPAERVVVWSETDAVELQNQIVSQNTKLDQAVDLGAAAVNAVASLSEQLKSVQDAIGELKSAQAAKEVQQVASFEVPDFTPPEPSITEDRVNELIEQFLSRNQVHAAVTQRQVQAPAPQVSTFTQAPACVGGTCYSAPMTRQRLFRSRSR